MVPLPEFMVTITILAFLFTILMIFIRPMGINEAWPAVIGAFLVFISGSVSTSDILKIGETVGGASITIISTIVMANVLESFGFFHWTAEILTAKAKGSGLRLFWYVNLLCFLMTLFFNNDGSILITTPILLILLQNLRLKTNQKVPYLLSGALIATASSAPIGVSNIVNLIGLKIVGMDLYMQTLMMFVPATLGLLLLLLLLFLYFHRQLPRKLVSSANHTTKNHPLAQDRSPIPIEHRTKFMAYILIFVFTVRISLFVASYFGIPIELVAVLGSLLLLLWRWYYLRITPTDMLKKTPWHILVFAFAMYVIIYGLNNIGLTGYLVQLLYPIVSQSLFHASLIMGGLLALMANIFNNHPALMVGTLTLTQMDLSPLTLKVAYLSNVIGGDVGSLLLPIGTLATLIWMHLLKKSKVKVTWATYMKVSFLVIPPTVLFTLVSLYFWVTWLFT
jgi:arsenical pump membrane protein